MTKMELAIEALEALPESSREEIAEMVLELAAAVSNASGRSALTEEQLAEVRRRRESGFQPGDASRIDRLLARLA